MPSPPDGDHVAYRVTWFPPDVQQRQQTVYTEAAADALMDEHADFAPMLEARDVSAWRYVRSPSFEAAMAERRQKEKP